MSSGTMSSAIASLKANKKLRKNKGSYSLFSKQIKGKSPAYRQLTKEESMKRKAEYTKQKNREIKQNRIFSLFMGVFYTSLTAYVIYILVL